MVYEYGNHLIVENDDRWRVRLKLSTGIREVEVTNLRSGQKFITKYNASILSDKEFLREMEIKGYRLI